jgi:hypothetical protein
MTSSDGLTSIPYRRTSEIAKSEGFHLGKLACEGIRIYKAATIIRLRDGCNVQLRLAALQIFRPGLYTIQEAAISDIAITIVIKLRLCEQGRKDIARMGVRNLPEPKQNPSASSHPTGC